MVFVPKIAAYKPRYTQCLKYENAPLRILTDLLTIIALSCRGVHAEGELRGSAFGLPRVTAGDQS